MNIPKFKPAKHYLGNYNIPCRLARVKNSKLPGIAARAIAMSKEDPACKIYLHGKGSKATAGWEKTILEQLFADGQLGAIVAAGMKEYEEDGDAYCDANPAEREEIGKIGIAPFMTISTIIIDGDRKEAILCGRTELDLNLVEHGINIYLQGGKWHYAQGDYYCRYADKLGPSLEEEEEEDEDAEPTPERKKFNKLFPPARKAAPVEKKSTALYGQWKLDKARTKEIYSRLGRSEMNTTFTIASHEKRILEFTARTFTDDKEFTVAGYERRDDWITLRLKDGALRERQFHLDDQGMVDYWGVAYRRLSDAEKVDIKKYNDDITLADKQAFPAAKQKLMESLKQMQDILSGITTK